MAQDLGVFYWTFTNKPTERRGANPVESEQIYGSETLRMVVQEGLPAF